MVDQDHEQLSCRLPTTKIGAHSSLTMEIISTNKNGQKLIYEGFMYTVQHERASGTRWQCVDRKCKGAGVEIHRL